MELYILIFFDIPIWIMFFYNIILIILVIKTIKHYRTESLYSLFIYPGIIGICWILVFIKYIYLAWFNKFISYIIKYMENYRFWIR